MKKILLLPVIMLLVLKGYSQFNNSWIDHSKTYFRFSLAKDTLCRISQAQLAAVGLGNTPAQHFQLWRNGEQVRIYTSVSSGPLSTTDYIEFWGEMNDGKTDKHLYLDTLTQLCDRYSLETDTATYFLTVNLNVTENLRYTQENNPVVGTSLTPDAYFMRRLESHYKNNINRGRARVVIEYVYCSSYDTGEGWSSGDVFPCCALSKVFTNINKYAAGPPNSVTFTIGASGGALYSRELVAKFFNTEVLKVGMPFFDYVKDTIRNLPLSVLPNNNNLAVSINGNGTDVNDRIAVSCFTVTYPATFNFNNESNFYFELAPNALGNYIIINNFNNNGVAPILYDMTNGRRYFGNIDVGGQVRFVLPPSSQPVRKFNLMSNAASNVYAVGGMSSKVFTNYGLAANQGDYLIISNKVLFNNGNGVNNVDLYRQYRASVTGGGYAAKVYDIDEITDQFGFAIKKNPAAVRDFILYAKHTFANPIKYVFIIGHGLSYMDYTTRQDDVVANQLNLVQTFGWPVSDILLACEPGTIDQVVPIGRLGAVNGAEVGAYLEKMKEYEQVQMSPNQTVADKGWMKNFLHTIGGSEPQETIDFTNYLNQYKIIAEDTLMGARVSTFAKSTNAAIEQEQSQSITNLFNEGLGYIKYFGHSSANELAINLNYPETYNNAGKYPFIHVSGCTVGNFFTYNPLRPSGNYANMSLSEKYLFLSNKGSIGFLGSTHFGIPPFLDFYNTNLYKNFCYDLYGQTIGQQIQQTVQTLGNVPLLDFYTRMHLEEITLHGDPAMKLNVFQKPDYAIEDQMVKFTPTIISVADNNFTLDIKMKNLGKATSDSIRVTVDQKLPNNTIRSLYSKKIPGIRNTDSISLVVPINPVTDKGRNELIIMLDSGNVVSEISETNNRLSKEFYIFEDELRPISPYNFSIVNQQNITYYASTANPLGEMRQYVMEIDTTELFNSAFKKTVNASGVGGLIQFDPTGVTFTENTVYYWRTATVPTGTGNYIWNNFSFIYLPTGGTGFNQSHYFQHLHSTGTDLSYNAGRQWVFPSSVTAVKMKTGVFPVSAREAQDFEINADGANIVQSVCVSSLPVGNLIVMSIFNPIGFTPVLNAETGQPGRFGSELVCADDKRFSFTYTLTTPERRTAAMNFLKNNVPPGYYVIVMNFANSNQGANSYVADWKLDDPTGTNTLYHTLKNAGFAAVDSFYKPRAFSFMYKNGDATFTPVWKVSEGVSDKVELDVNAPTGKGSGTLVSPLFGPAKKWQQFLWRGRTKESIPGDSITFDIIGVDQAGTETPLYTVDSSTKIFDISAVDANLYPYIKLKMHNEDFMSGTPYQLDYWRLKYAPLPEGAIAPNILFAMKDTVEQGEKIDFKLAFKNISPINFDSLMKIGFSVRDKNNVNNPLNVPKGKKLVAGDTLVISYPIDTRNFSGNNTLIVDVNPANDQPEEYHFNNILYKNFYVKGDVYNPLLDVTFDGVHILNKDIVSAKPHILVDLKDESRFMALADTSLLKVQVRYPDGNIRDFHFGDLMQFTPANLATGNNTATIDFKPVFTDDGEYELIVSGKDVVGNYAGALNYHVVFTVISKAMISNLLNYPNPFTTSTAFVFTITGEQVPQNIRIQVLTITGKIVREITKDELGPLHVGPNITEFKWDGTDSYGQKLANGVYLYRVLTNLNGKSLDKYKAQGDKTDQYFNKGYGKMVILR